MSGAQYIPVVGRRKRVLARVAGLVLWTLVQADPSAAVVLHAGDILVADEGFGDTLDGAVVRVDPVTGAQEVIASGVNLIDPGGLAVEPAGTVLVVDKGQFLNNDAKLVRVVPETGAQTILTSGGELNDAIGIAVVSDGRIFVAEPGEGGDPDGKIIEVNPISGAQTVVATGTDFVGVALASSGDLWLADPGADSFAGTVSRLDPDGGLPQVISSGGDFGFPRGVADDGGGQVLVADRDAFSGGGAVFRVNPANGNQAVLSTGPPLDDPVDVALLPDGDIAVVDLRSFSSNQGVYRIDPTTGIATPLSTGGVFISTKGIAVVPEFADHVVGGSFDVPADLGDWTFFTGPGSSVNWDSMDVSGSAASGSMRVEVDATDSGNAVQSNQCYPVLGGASYHYGAFVFQPSTSPLGQAFVRVQWFRGENCDDFIRSTDSGITSTLDSWVKLSEIDAIAPADARSAQLILTTFEDPMQLANRVAFWDQVSFIPEPSSTWSELAAALALLLHRRQRSCRRESASAGAVSIPRISPP